VLYRQLREMRDRGRAGVQPLASTGAKITEVARAQDIPIEENEAGALSNVELGDEIPEELYKAVAEVLVFLLRLTRSPR
jgi:flagellar biosynthesis protein